MTMEIVYLVAFILGIVLSVLTVAGGFHHLHIGHFHIGHGAHAHVHGTHAHSASHGFPSINGFTLTAFLCWFGAAGYLLRHFSLLAGPLILSLAVLSGFGGAALIWATLFRVLLPRERVLTAEETAMPGVVARVSGSIRESGGTGEIIFSQGGARRSTPARSEDGGVIQRGAEVVVIRYEHGIAYVRRFDELGDGFV